MEHSVFHKEEIKMEDDPDPLNCWDGGEDGEGDPGDPGQEKQKGNYGGFGDEEADEVKNYQEMFPGLSDEDSFDSTGDEKMCVKLDPSTVSNKLDYLAAGQSKEPVSKQHSAALAAAMEAYPDIYGVKPKSKAEETAPSASWDAGQDLVSKYCKKILHYCKLCKFSFPSVQINVQHWSIVHKEAPRFFCRFQNCEFSSNSDDMRLHIIQHLVDTSKIAMCDHCCVAQLPQHLLNHRRQCLVKGAVAESEAEVSKAGGDNDVVSQMIAQIIMQGLQMPRSGHWKKNPPVRIYFKNCFNKCTKCEKDFDSSEELVLHWQDEHKGDTFMVACRFNSCTFQTDSHDSLKDHIMQHLIRVGKVVKCPSCAKLLKHDYIKTHLKECTEDNIKGNHGRPGRRSGTFTRDHFCHLCEKKFKTEKFLIKHLESEHSSEQFNTYKCEYCDSSFMSVSKLNAHKRSIHARANSYTCDICKKVFSSRGALNSHKVVHENGAHSCEHCNKTFKTKSSLSAHVRGVHPKDFDYFCDRCDYKTNRTEGLKIHIMNKHEPNLKPFMCELCEDKFATKQLLEKHVETHLPDEEKYQYSCHYCPSMFTRKNNLVVHIKSHHKQ